MPVAMNLWARSAPGATPKVTLSYGCAKFSYDTREVGMRFAQRGTVIWMIFDIRDNRAKELVCLVLWWNIWKVRKGEKMKEALSLREIPSTTKLCLWKQQGNLSFSRSCRYTPVCVNLHQGIEGASKVLGRFSAWSGRGVCKIRATILGSWVYKLEIKCDG